VGGAVLTACGGGGGGGGATTPPPPTSQGPTWTQNVFEPASNFKDQCANPRSGVDIEGTPFPDQAGTLLDELFWLRSWTEETYLWNDEVIDRNPRDFNSRTAYFQVLKTEAVEPSGEDRDDFHFSEPTAEFLAARNSVGNPGYGVRFALLRTSPPRDIRVAYADPDTPASTPIAGTIPFQRGSRILEIDGGDVVNGFNTQAQVNQLNTLLFSPQSVGETHAFRVQDIDGTIRTFNITTADVSRKPVLETKVIDTPTGKVGYIVFNTFSPFSSEEEIILAMREMELAGVTDLVLDLRYNGGGLLAVASQVGYMIAGAGQTNGKAFYNFIFNDDAGDRNPVDGTVNDPFGFFSEVLGFDTGSTLVPGSPLPALNLSRVFILSTGGTCSASESVINGLRGIDVEVVLIGNVTCGKPYGFFPQDNCGETYYTVQFQGANDKGFAAFADGFVPNNSSFPFGVKVPGCVVADDLTKALGDETENLLATALSYRTSGTCSTGTPKVSTGADEEAKTETPTDRQLEVEDPNTFHDNNLDVRLPR
ncbi:MAG: S41 family peptidase, partial [Pseudomonadota bacterium]|nr:S41 family peptidase [Pseudomonadota bacterium]